MKKIYLLLFPLLVCGMCEKDKPEDNPPPTVVEQDSRLMKTWVLQKAALEGEYDTLHYTWSSCDDARNNDGWYFTLTFQPDTAKEKVCTPISSAEFKYNQWSTANNSRVALKNQYSEIRYDYDFIGVTLVTRDHYYPDTNETRIRYWR